MILGLLALASFTYGMIRAVASQIPACDPAHQQRIEVDGYIYSATPHRVLAVLRGRESRVLVPSNKISPWMKHAIVAVEDKRFYEHRGVDVHGMLRALWADIRNQKIVEGGSTITQQFVKNSCISDQRSIARKLKEAALAWQLEQRWSKDRILTAYLNTIYFGNGAYGVEQAAQTYFHRQAKKLSIAQAALLAGIPEDPSLYDPVTNPKDAKERRDLVLKDMHDQGDITDSQYQLALATPLPRPQDVRLPGEQGPAPYFANYVRQQLVDRYGSGRVFGGGFRVYTTIDLNLQYLARRAIAENLTDPNGPSAALVAINPKNGQVLAMVGGNNYRKSQFNLAVQGERQPGSSFKPFVLATALKQGISPDTTFVSGPVSIPLGDRVWYVHNYENADLGTIPLSTATTVSDNTVYAQLTRLVGPAAVVRTAHALGITSRLNNYFAIGLGAEAVNPLEMARAFSGFANGGRRIDGAAFGNLPRAIVRVDDDHGHLIDDNAVVGRRVLPPNTTALLNSLLERVVTSGTGKHAQLPDGRPVAGKTGTTENYGDAWFVGYTPQLAAAVWVGYPNQLRPMLTDFHGQPVAGGTFPALIWKSFMERALPYLQAPPESFPSPQLPYASQKYVVFRNGQLELDNGNCHSPKLVLYYSGEGPSRTANCKPNEVDVPQVVGDTVAQAKARLAAQPLTPAFIWRPAQPGERLGIVRAQFPKNGTLSSYDKLTLVLSKPLHGVVPNVVGLRLKRARALLARLELDLDVEPGGARDSARVLSQSVHWDVAAKPGMKLTLVVAAG
jgi:penicillin-binding protein 1A